jgi:hypothetical protein
MGMNGAIPLTREPEVGCLADLAGLVELHRIRWNSGGIVRLKLPPNVENRSAIRRTLL